MNLLKNPENKKPGIYLLAGCAISFFLFSLFGILHHEMWLDEMHHWLLAKESNSVYELLTNMKFEGHPPLWNMLLFILTRFTPDPFIMQLFHILLATLAMTVFFYYAPFSTLFKTGVLFSYFIFYEFSIISRNYAVGIFLLWFICALFESKKNIFLLLCLLLGLLAHVHLFFLFIALGLFIVLLRQNYSQITRINYVGGVLLFSLFLILSVLFIIPPDTHFLNHYNPEPVLSFKRMEKAFSIFFKAFLHIPDFTTTNCWNSNWLINKFRLMIILPSIFCMIIPFFIFYKNRVSLFLFYFPSVLTACFLYTTPLASGVRYFGLIYIIFLMALWHRNTSGQQHAGRYAPSLERFFMMVNKRIEKSFLIIVFSTQILSSFIMLAKDYSLSFSQAKHTAQFLNALPTPKKNIAVSNIASISALGGFLSQNIYSLEAGTRSTYSPWNVIPFQYNEEQIVDRLKSVIQFDTSGWMMITNHLLVFNHKKDSPLLNYKDDSIQISLIKSFTGSMVSTENYFIYSVDKPSVGVNTSR